MQYQIALPTIWPDMVEFHSASLEIRGRIKKEAEESVVKHKSADMYAGRPNKINIRKISLMVFGSLSLKLEHTRAGDHNEWPINDTTN